MSSSYDRNPYTQGYYTPPGGPGGYVTQQQLDRRDVPAYGGAMSPATQWEADRAGRLGQGRGDIFLDQGTGLENMTGGGQRFATANQVELGRRADSLYRDAGVANANQNAVRGDTMSAIGRLRSFYEAGPGPSAAQAQLQAGQDANARNAMSIARSSGPAAGAAAQRRAQNAAMVGGVQTNQQAAILRANEENAWRGQKLGAMQAEQGALSGVRQGDAAVMGTQLGAGQGASQVALGQGQLGAQYGQQMINARTGMGALAGQQWAAGEGNRAGVIGAQFAADQNRYNAAQGYAERSDVRERERQAAQDRAAMQTAGTVIGGAATMAASDVNAKTGIRPVTSLVDSFRSDPEIDPDTGRELTPVEIQQRKQDAQRGQQFGSTLAQLGAIASDRAAKTAIRPLDDVFGASEARAAQDTGPRFDLRPAEAFSYEYRDPARHGEGQFVGPMAQDLEHLPGVVQQQADGTKAVDTGRVAMVTASAVGEQQKEIDRLKVLLDASERRASRDTGPRIR